MPNYKDFDLDIQKNKTDNKMMGGPNSKGPACKSLNETCRTYNNGCTYSYCEPGSCMLDGTMCMM